ncbi:MAG TPA: hypothetical protein VGD96_05070 [Bradyrhizobium sp.]
MRLARELTGMVNAKFRERRCYGFEMVDAPGTSKAAESAVNGKFTANPARGFFRKFSPD